MKMFLLHTHTHTRSSASSRQDDLSAISQYMKCPGILDDHLLISDISTQLSYSYFKDNMPKSNLCSLFFFISKQSKLTTTPPCSLFPSKSVHPPVFRNQT